MVRLYMFILRRNQNKTVMEIRSCKKILFVNFYSNDTENKSDEHDQAEINSKIN